MRHFSLVVSFVLAASAAPLLAQDGAFKEFKSWQVNCSQTRACDMRQFMAGSAISGFELKRSAKPQAPVSFAVSMSEGVLGEATGDLGASLSVDGSAAVQVGAAGIALGEGGWSATLSGDFIGNGLVTAIRNGTKLQVELFRGKTRVKGEIQLAGAAASLLFIDEFQNRVGHTDALTAKGNKPPNPEPELSDMASLADFPQEIQAAFKDDGLCAETDESMLEGNALAHRLDKDRTLYVTPCGMGGPYNLPYAVFLESFGSIKPLVFPTMAEGGPSTMEVAYNLAYDDKAGTFAAFFKGRGIGDCGTYSTWKLSTGAADTSLVLTEERVRDCPEEVDENASTDIENWPQVWPRE
ncbi:DUF1176 domain-containing protein [Rhizobium sp. RU36D]|uniref:DUF1176 domain-containing protein n=1 Tax=Rhizobium sp. RU36D TaxID=1907415 RepID=UPI0009D80F3B|nr:DUF1176 domain-containing protein [Rhizobium sp. RU36D]SMD18893.1 Protein of unknown function [Rhizobium sp. RU36D]